MEKYRVRDISKQRVAEEMKNIPARKRCFISVITDKLKKICESVNQ